MKLTPTAEQIEDATKMAAGDLGNFSVPGSGKTLTTIEAFRKFGHGGLVVAPTIALTMWGEELQEQLGATAQVIRSNATPIDWSVDFHVTSYKLMTMKVGAALCAEYAATADQSRAMALDEAHKAKSVDAKITHAIYGDVLHNTGGAYQWFDRVWPLTGTPLTRFNDDLYPMLASLWPHVLHKYNCHDYEAFMESFTWRVWKAHAGANQKRYMPVSSTNMDIMHRILYDDIGCIRRTVVEGLPPVRFRVQPVKLESPAWLDVTKEEHKALQLLEKADAIDQLLDSEGKGDTPIATLRRSMGLMTIKNSLEFMVDAANAGPILVGIVHKDVSSVARQRLKMAGMRVEEINGATPWQTRDDIQARFNAGEIDVVLGQIHACGEVLNLQGASSHIIILEDDFSPSAISQFYKRVARRGQVYNCIVDFMTPLCSLGQAIVEIREKKRYAHDLVLDPRN